MKKRKESYCPLCGEPLQREERPVIRKRAAYYCKSCDQVFTREMGRAVFKDSSTRRLTATVDVVGDVRLSRDKEALNDALKGHTLKVSGYLCEVTIKDIRL